MTTVRAGKKNLTVVPVAGRSHDARVLLGGHVLRQYDRVAASRSPGSPRAPRWRTPSCGVVVVAAGVAVAGLGGGGKATGEALDGAAFADDVLLAVSAAYHSLQTDRLVLVNLQFHARHESHIHRVTKQEDTVAVLGCGRGHRPQIVATPPKFCRTLVTLWSNDSRKKIVNLMP